MKHNRTKPKRTRVVLDEKHGQGHVDHDPAELERQARRRDLAWLRDRCATRTNNEGSQA
ncbi:hypothetical protein [Amycolatopsis taiwanensis]|uniref:hypothetical protein n=1 Tax=Amycolatopsis taiwanensis TaxID=342230 RepID=UPI0004B1EFEE|nr:hypothetical protein [Amycolatopsis taiwanensis]